MFGYRNKHQRLLLTAVRDSIFFQFTTGFFTSYILYFCISFQQAEALGFISDNQTTSG
jgi:hypothetical protein